MIDLQGFNLLAKIRGVPADMDHIANAQRTYDSSRMIATDG